VEKSRLKLSVDEIKAPLYPELQLTWMPDTGPARANTAMSHVIVKPRSLPAIDTTSKFSIIISLKRMY
jgi:hypothetical protein